MKNIIIIFLILLNLQSFTKADDIRDFEIEGMSIYDSLLDFIEINYINSDKEYLYKSKKYYTVEVRKDYEVFDSIQVAIKDKDKKYIIEIIILTNVTSY